MPRDLSFFGTANYPLRPSQIDALVRCPMSAALAFLDAPGDTGGVAADTGSLAHAGVAAWHLSQRSLEAGMSAIAASLPKFPRGDKRDAELFYEAYIADPRNQVAEVTHVEHRVRAELEAHETDPTGMPIYIQGTLDQIRRDEDGVLRVYDLKTGAPEGWAMLHAYALQQSAYAVAATQTLGEPVHPGALIRAAGWRKRGVDPRSRPDGVFFYASWTLEDCYLLLDYVRMIVGNIRSGELNWSPGHHCTFCHLGGLDSCLPTAKSRLSLEVVR